MTGILFETPRLRCRRWIAADMNPLYEVYSDPVGARYVDDGQPITRDECENWMDVTARNYATRGYGMFALEDRETGAVVGFCGLVHPGGQEEPEIKYAFRQATWGQGLATEMVPALLGYGAEVFGLKRIIATVAEANGASQRVLEKAGARRCGLLEDDDGRTVVFEWFPGEG